MSAEFDIQAAIFNALSGDADLTDLGPDIVDFGQSVDDGSTIYPYVSIGNILLGEWDTDTSTGFDMSARIHTWSNTGSVKETKLIQGAIYDVLHNSPLTVSGFNSLILYRVDTDAMRSSSGAFHGVCEYRGLFDRTP